MRDSRSWQEPLIKQVVAFFEDEHRPAVAASKFCEVELGLYLMRRLLPHQPAQAAWVLFGGYPFAADQIAVEGEQMVRIGRHLLWELRRRRNWHQLLAWYQELPSELRGFDVTSDTESPRRLQPSIAYDRWELFEGTLTLPPPFAVRQMPVAEPGTWRFTEGRMWSSVTIPERLPMASPDPHHLTPVRDAGPMRVPWSELHETAEWMDRLLADLELPAGNWKRRLSRIWPYVPNSSNTDYEQSNELVVDRLHHMVGMVGAGKSTLRDILAVWAARNGRRCTLVVGDVAEALHLVALFDSLGLAAAPILGATTRERHIQRLHRRLANQGQSTLLTHDSPGFDYLSTACPLDALRGVETELPMQYSHSPCTRLQSVSKQRTRSVLSPLAPDAPNDDEPRKPRLHGCPLWSSCPRHHGSRELANAMIWVATPASLVHSAVPAHQNVERIRYWELACRRSDMIIVDEADRVQMQLDTMFAPAAVLAGRAPNSWLDEVAQHKVEELARSGRVQLSDSDVMRWTAATNTVTAATDRIYFMLLRNPDLRTWVEADYFSAWTLQAKITSEWFGDDDAHDAADSPESSSADDTDDEQDEPDEAPSHPAPGEGMLSREDITQILDDFRDDPLGDGYRRSRQGRPRRPEAQPLIALTRQLLATTGTTAAREQAVRQLVALSGRAEPKRGAYKTDKEYLKAKRQFRRQTVQFEFTLILASLHNRLDLMTEMWPRVEAALNLASSSNVLSRKPPEDYRPLVPESPMGNILGFQFQSDEESRNGLASGELRFFRCAGNGRELLLTMPDLAFADGLAAPAVLLMSGTSWAGTSTRYHVLAPVNSILKPPAEELKAIATSTFRTHFLAHNGKPLRLSGARPHVRPIVLEQMLSQLARRTADSGLSPMEQELTAIADPRRRRLLILTGSYAEARRAKAFLDTIPRWSGKVCQLVADDAEYDMDWQADAATAGTLRRGDVAAFATTGAEVLVAPLLAVERGHNILFDGVAAIGSVYFLARPHPRPDDISLAIQAINDWASRHIHDGTFQAEFTDGDSLDEAGLKFRNQARAQWRYLLNRQLSWRRLKPKEKVSFTWDQLVVIWQVVGRLVRGGVPARVVFVDAPFAERAANRMANTDANKNGGKELVDTWKTSLLIAMHRVLDPYLSDDPSMPVAGSTLPPTPLERALVATLYQPLHAALSGIFPTVDRTPMV